MKVLLIVLVVFVYLVIGAIIDAEYDIGPSIVVWPLLIPIWAAYKVGYAIHDFFEEERWKKLFKKKRRRIIK